MEVKSKIDEFCALNVVYLSIDSENVKLKMNKFCNLGKE